MASTANEIIRDAFEWLMVFKPGEDPDPASGDTAFRQLNLMLGSWAQQRGTIPAITREVFTLTANKGGVSDPYTIGVGGTLNTARPSNQQSIVGAARLQTTSTPPYEYPITIHSDASWASIAGKDQTSTAFTGLYYQPLYVGGLGRIYLEPEPTTAADSLVLYITRGISAFADRTTSYAFPDGYEDAIGTNLAMRLAVPFHVDPSKELRELARESLALLKRINHTPVELPMTLMVGGGRWNIYTGEVQ